MKETIKPDEILTKMPSLTALRAFVAAGRYKSFTHTKQDVHNRELQVFKQWLINCFRSQ
jgi:hypothetical protein